MSIRSAAFLTKCVMIVSATSDELVELPLGQEDGDRLSKTQKQKSEMPAQYPAKIEESDNVNLLQLRPHLTENPSPFCNLKPHKCNLESQFSSTDTTSRSLSILLRGEPFRRGRHGNTSLDFKGFGQIEQRRAAQSHVKRLIQPFEDLGFKVEVVGVIPEHVEKAAPDALVLKDLEKIYKPWMQAGFKVVDSKSQQENWNLAWKELLHVEGSSRGFCLVLRFDVVLKTNIAQLIVQHLQEDPKKMLIPFFEEVGENPRDPGFPKMSDLFQWVPHQLQRCLANNVSPSHLCGWRDYTNLIGVDHIGAIWRNTGKFSGCKASTTDPEFFPNLLYRCAGRPEGLSVTNGQCPFMSND